MAPAINFYLMINLDREGQLKTNEVIRNPSMVSWRIVCVICSKNSENLNVFSHFLRPEFQYVLLQRKIM